MRGGLPDLHSTGTLLTAAALEALLQRGEVPDDLAGVHRWVSESLTKPHPELGRKGDVCPFVGGALLQDAIYYAPVAGEVDAGDVVEIVSSLGHLFGVLPPLPGSGSLAVFKSIVVVFLEMAEPDAPRLIVETHHETLKSVLVEHGLMLGEFHKGYRLPGTYNPDFPAGEAPAPVLALRPMLRRDAIFLREREEWRKAHERRFGFGPSDKEAG